MRVQAINTNLCKFNKQYTVRPVISGGGQYHCDSVTFSGLFRKTKTEELNSDELITSYKMADVLHRLDKNSILVIGDSRDAFTKARTQAALTASNSFLPSPKDVKEIYFINTNFSAPLIIARKNNNHFLVHGFTESIANSKKIAFKDDRVNLDRVVSYNDVIKTIDGIKLEFIKTRSKTNGPMCDARYPVESFLSEGEMLTGGIVFKKFADITMQKVHNNRNEAFSELVTQNIPHRTFKDVAGMDETIEQVKKQILYPMLYPKAFPDITNCGTIFYGPPGTGKTLLAQAIIGEAKERKDKIVNFINIDGQSLESKWIGDTEAAWRNVFKEAVEKQPCILFIDEIDAVLAKRTDNDSGGSRHRNGVVSQFLTLISDIEKNNHKIWIIGATNRPELIDSAIKRSGRIGNLIEVKKPDEKGCLAILNHYLKDKNVSDNFDRVQFAKEIYALGYTGADIANLVNMARDRMYERLGIFEQMNNNTFVDRELDDLEYIDEDFKKNIKEI